MDVVAAVAFLIVMLLVELPHLLKKRGYLSSHSKKVEFFYLLLIAAPLVICIVAAINYFLNH